MTGSDGQWIHYKVYLTERWDMWFLAVRPEAMVMLTAACFVLSQPGSADQHLDQSNIRSPHSRLRGVRKQPRLGWQEVTHHQ